MPKTKEEIRQIRKKDIEELSGMRNGNNFTLSLYLGIKTDRAVRYELSSEANSVITDEIKKMKNGAIFSKEQKKLIIKLSAKLKRKADFIRVSQKTRTLIMFFDSKNLEKIYRLPVYIPSRLVIEQDPYIHPLVKALEKFPKYLSVSVERDRAEFYSIFLGEMENEPEIILSDVPKKIRTSSSDDWHGRREHRIERHIEDHLNRHFKIAASKIRDYLRKNEFNFLVIGGHGEITGKFLEFLDKKSAEKLIGTFGLAHRDHNFIKEKSIAIINEHEKNLEKKTTDSLLDGASAKKWLTVLGTDSVIKNLYRHNIESLVIGRDYKQRGYVCSKCHLVSAYADQCEKCGGKASPVSDLADEIIEEAIKRKIEVKHLSYSHKEFDKFGIGAFLSLPTR